MCDLCKESVSSHSECRNRPGIPDRVEEHLVAGRTLKTACGEQWTTKTSSGVNAWEECDRTSSSIDFDTTILVGFPVDSISGGKVTWKENGTGSSSWMSRGL